MCYRSLGHIPGTQRIRRHTRQSCNKGRRHNQPTEVDNYVYTYHSVIHLQQITFVSVLEDAAITRKARQYRGVLQ